MLLYPATVRPDSDTFVVLFPDIPHAHTNGSSREDALSHGRVKQVAIVGLPSLVASAKGPTLQCPPRVGRPKVGTARRMGIHKQQVERLMDIEHTSRIEQLESAFQELLRGTNRAVRSRAAET